MRTAAWLVNKKLIFRIGFLIGDRLYRIEPHASRCYPHCNGRDLLESCSTAGIIALAGASSGGGVHRAASRPGGVVPRFGCAAARRGAFRLLESRPARPGTPDHASPPPRNLDGETYPPARGPGIADGVDAFRKGSGDAGSICRSGCRDRDVVPGSYGGAAARGRPFVLRGPTDHSAAAAGNVGFWKARTAPL